jgi:hypothetical protein
MLDKNGQFFSYQSHKTKAKETLRERVHQFAGTQTFPATD